MRHRTTERLRLDAVGPGDVDVLHDLYSDPRGWEHAPAGRHSTRAETEQVVRAAVAQWEGDGLAYWVARLRATGALVGTGGVRRGAEGAWNLFYHVHGDARGLGYASEIARAALEAAGQLDRSVAVIARVRPEHAASRAVAERVGLRSLGPAVDADGVVRVRYANRPTDRAPAGSSTPEATVPWELERALRAGWSAATCDPVDVEA